jgi:prenylcysteine oxidase/farnesylcysteine lyase
MTKAHKPPGAGAAGTSTAYHLRRFATEANTPVNITIFERSPYIGGRSTTVDAYESPDSPAIELGASIFIEANKILINASKEFGLELQSAVGQRPNGFDGPSMAIWNGDELVFSQTTRGGWWDLAKMIWRYGLAPLKAQKAMQTSIGMFLKMYEEDHFPWKDLTETVEKAGLLEQTGVTGEQLLKAQGVDDLFAREVVQASYGPYTLIANTTC